MRNYSREADEEQKRIESTIFKAESAERKREQSQDAALRESMGRGLDERQRDAVPTRDAQQPDTAPESRQPKTK